MKVPAPRLDWEAHSGVSLGKSHKTRHMLCPWSLLDDYAATCHHRAPWLIWTPCWANLAPTGLGG